MAIERGEIYRVKPGADDRWRTARQCPPVSHPFDHRLQQGADDRRRTSVLVPPSPSAVDRASFPATHMGILGRNDKGILFPPSRGITEVVLSMTDFLGLQCSVHDSPTAQSAGTPRQRIKRQYGTRGKIASRRMRKKAEACQRDL
jgi:hypothetical protein